MHKIELALIGILLVCPFATLANNYEHRNISVRDLVHEYARHHDTNFVISHRVKGTVEMLDEKIENMFKSEFIDVLEYHDFIATRKDGVVYIFTRFEVDHLGKGVGPIWQG